MKYANLKSCFSDPPVVSVTALSMPNLVVNEGGEANLECRYDSNPSSLKRVTWYALQNDGTIYIYNFDRY